MKPKLYMETTIPSYLTARPSRDLIVAGHQQLTWEWWQKRKTDFDIYISQFVLDEANAGDTEAAKKRLNILAEFELLDINEVVTSLASAILESGIIPRKATTDAAHIAVATVHRMQFLMTWNCIHIANAEITERVRKVCAEHGFACPVICTPEELMGE
ncbi:type II toxin-antitoxin system VapC family toxin [bacterium]|nr:type II toxin-antitoxin system VapC family toxin [bacterium]